jgi:hypothetical protein
MPLCDRASFCAVLAASFVLAGHASALTETAPPPAPADDRRIVVTGEVEPPSHDAVSDQARNISIIGDPLHSPLPRFEDHLCPGVLGMKADAAEVIVQRIRFTAEDLGIRLAEDNGTCQPNLIVAFVDGAQEQLIAMARNNGYMFAGLSVTARGELFDVSGAARVWTNTLTRTRDGMPVPTSRDAASSPERQGTTLAGSDAQGNALMGQTGARLPPVAAMQAAHSRIFFPTREDIVSVLVLFERDKVRDKTLLQLADYAIMRGLASTRETSGEPAAATILSLFDGDGPKPQRMTAFDRAYLAVLYEGMANLPAASKLADVHGEMERVTESQE